MPKQSKILTATIAALACIAPPPASAQALYQQRFEDAEPSWRPAGSDTKFQIVRHARLRDAARTGAAGELVQISATNGSYVHLAHAVDPARVIGELNASVWIKADRPGPQVLARVVLPRTKDPASGSPLSALVYGTSYNTVGQWQQLRVDNLPQLLNRQARVLRSQFGPDVDAREAYIDQVLLNVYGGPGVTTVWIDDLEVSGVVAPQNQANLPRPEPSGRGGVSPTHREVGGDGRIPIVAASTSSSAGSSAAATGSDGNEPLIQVRGPVTLASGRPVLLRIIQHQGESLGQLQQLGFNTVLLATTPSREVLEEARQRGLWLICPPPTAPRIERDGISGDFRPVVAWHLGSHLAGAELAQTQQLAQIVRQHDPLSRPIIAHTEVETPRYGRVLDVLVVGRHPLGTSLNLSHYTQWLTQQVRLARPGTPVWARIQTDIDPLVLKQWDAFGRMGSEEGADLAGRTFTADADEQQVRTLVRSALATGARGLLFDSRSSLAAADPATRRRRLVLELINLELALIEPWAAGGSFVTAATCNDRKVVGASLQTERARLMLPIRWGREDQFVPEPFSEGGRSFVVPGVAESNEAYELTPAGVRPLRHSRVTGGIRVVQDNYSGGSAILMTSDAHGISSLMRQAGQTQSRAAELSRELAARKLELVESVQQRLAPGAQAKPGSPLVAARESLAQCDRLVASGDMRRAYDQSEKTLRTLSSLQRTMWSERVPSDSSVVTSPLATHFLALGKHADLLQALRSAQFLPVELPGGDFESLELLLQSGWQHFRHPSEAVQSEVELSPSQPHGGGYSLRLQARPVDPDEPERLLETAPVWVTTPAVGVRAGQMVRISGWVDVPGPIRGSVEGLMVIDSCGGLPLALRIGRTSGWKQFTLYRSAVDADSISVTFALTGLGEARVDDVTIEALGAPAAGPSQQARAHPPFGVARPER